MRVVQFTDEELIELQSTLVEKMLELNLDMTKQPQGATSHALAEQEIVKLGRLAEKCSPDNPPHNSQAKY